MSNRVCVLAALILVLALPAVAQVNYCHSGGMACQYLRNEAFVDQPTTSYPTPNEWVIGNISWWTTVTDTCGTGTTKAAKLAPGGGVLQEFTATEFENWSVNLDIYFGDSGGTSTDTINVYVRNLDTGVQEIFSVDATEYGLCASNVAIDLNNDYTNADVRVTVRRGTNSSMNHISVDNISFWGTIY